MITTKFITSDGEECISVITKNESEGQKALLTYPYFWKSEQISNKTKIYIFKKAKHG